MAKSPGHQKWPDHKVKEQHLKNRVRVEVDGEVIADSDDVVEVAEDENPARYYFPRADVKMDKLERSDTKSECPFKGTASYFSVTTDDRKIDDAVWTYEEPFEEHADLKDRIAFWVEKSAAISIRK
jgi:uncharacterized protein (DUF427 family)